MARSLRLGTPYLLTLKAVNCSSGESLASTEAQASDKNHVLDALGKAASEIREKLGESLSTVQKFDTPLEQATTPSLEALQAFSLAWKVEVRGKTIPPRQCHCFKRAIKLDQNFALAYADLGWKPIRNLQEGSLASADVRKAFELRESVSEYEKLYIEAQIRLPCYGRFGESATDHGSLRTNLSKRLGAASRIGQVFVDHAWAT